jgi:hypothetical protein
MNTTKIIAVFGIVLVLVVGLAIGGTWFVQKSLLENQYQTQLNTQVAQLQLELAQVNKEVTDNQTLTLELERTKQETARLNNLLQSAEVQNALTHQDYKKALDDFTLLTFEKCDVVIDIAKDIEREARHIREDIRDELQDKEDQRKEYTESLQDAENRDDAYDIRKFQRKLDNVEDDKEVLDDDYDDASKQYSRDKSRRKAVERQCRKLESF